MGRSAKHLFLLPLAALVGCRSSAEVPTAPLTSAEIEAAMAAPSPFEDRLAQIVGVDVATIINALTRSVDQATFKCVEERGFTLTPQQRSRISGDSPDGSPGQTYGGQVRLIRQNAEENPQPLPPDLVEAIDRCIPEALAEAPDVLRAYTDLEGDLSADFASRVRSDPRYIEASAQEEECLLSLGYGLNAESALSAITSDAYDADRAYRGGTMPKAEFDRRMTSLEAKEENLASQLDQCVKPRLATAAVVIAEAQDEYLDANSATLEEVGAQVKQALLDSGIDFSA